MFGYIDTKVSNQSLRSILSVKLCVSDIMKLYMDIRRFAQFCQVYPPRIEGSSFTLTFVKYLIVGFYDLM